MHGRLATIGIALATFLQVAEAAAQPTAPPLGAPSRGVVIGEAQVLKRAAAADAAARPRGLAADTVIEKAQELKRKHAKDAPPPPPPLSVGRIVEQVQALKRKAAEAAVVRNREAAALITEVDRGPSALEIQERKEAFIHERLDPLLGDRRAFLINLDERIRAHGILAFVAGLSDESKATCADLVRITEEQRALMLSRPDLFGEDDLRSNHVLSSLLKILAE